MIMILLGVLCFIIPAVIWGLYLLAFRMRSMHAVGTIIDYHGDSETQAPVVEFQLPDGTKVTFTESTHTSEGIVEFLIDLISRFVMKKDLNTVNVLYDPNNPQKARVNNFTYFYFMPILMFAIGFCIILYAIPMFRDILTPIFDFIERFTRSL